jgi:hypothetical protein
MENEHLMLSEVFDKDLHDIATSIATRARYHQKILSAIGDISLPRDAYVNSWGRDLNIYTYDKGVWMQCFKELPLRGMVKTVKPDGITLEGKINGINVKLSLHSQEMCEIEVVKKRRTVVVETKVKNCKPVTSL